MNALQPIKDGQEREQAGASSSSLLLAPQAAPAQPSPLSSGLAETSSIAARRRRLEAELAALNAMHPEASGSPNLPTIPTPSTTSNDGSSEQPSPSLGTASLHQSQYLSEPENRTLRDRDGRYEEIGREDIEESEDEEGHDAAPTSPPASGWWPAWGRRSSGYEPVKTE